MTTSCGLIRTRVQLKVDKEARLDAIQNEPID